MDVRQGTTLLTAVGAFIGTLVVIQLWLVAASLEALYSNETSVLVPAAVASLVLFLVNLRLLSWGRGPQQGRSAPGRR
jgi:hypothetical protein